MSLYETRDCGHSEIVLSKKCSICERIRKNWEYDLMKKTLQEIADEDFRGNRSSGSVKAFKALQAIAQQASGSEEK